MGQICLQKFHQATLADGELRINYSCACQVPFTLTLVLIKDILRTYKTNDDTIELH